MTYSFSSFDGELKRIKEHFSGELSSLRTGRANPAIVKDILVDAYGSKMKLEGVASITTQDARTLVIQPWDKGVVAAIESAIRNSNLGIQPVVDKDVIRVILPSLTGERREQLMKLVGEKSEDARIASRKARDEIWKDIQAQEREKKMSEDEKFRAKDELQKKIDHFNRELDDVAERKRTEIRT
ncbi:MAG: ribosome recycling factor [Candidatus Niyogibacteria bacterium]|nr:ribosome recycling factor [Candidatus Niyogibacteria bacterium]